MRTTTWIVAAGLACVALGACSKPTPEEEVEKALGSERVFQVMKEHYPAEYGQIKGVLVSHLAAGNRNMPQLVASVRPLEQSLVQRQMRLADDANAVQTLQVIRDQTGKVLDRPEVCGPMLANRVPPGVDLPAVLGKDMAEREMALHAAILEQTAERPAKPTPSSYLAEHGQTLAQTAMSGLSPAEVALVQPALAGGLPPASGPSAAAFCKFTHLLVGEMAKQPPVEAGRLFRAMSAASSGG